MRFARVLDAFRIVMFAAWVPSLVLAAEGTKVRSHPAMRPLPGLSNRPMAQGPAWFVDPRGGDDAQEGSEQKPWETIRHALGCLEPGVTLYLRGGTYYETVTLNASGTADRPITMRSYPGELAVLDGGLRGG